MHADLVMTKDVVTCSPDDIVKDVLKTLEGKNFRMIPVVDNEKYVVGAINTLSLLGKLVPSYIIQGYLKSIPYAPDMGMLRKHYSEIIDCKVSEVMERDPTIINSSESLLSVTAALITYDRFEYGIVVDKQKKLIGIIAASDILRCLHDCNPEDVFDA
jgi:predicted transcriptional regulator